MANNLSISARTYARLHRFGLNFRHEGDPALYYGYKIFQVAAFRAGFWRVVRVSVPSD